MSGKIKKTSEDMSFSFSRWFRRVYSNAPTAVILTILIMGYTVFLFGGGLYTLINNPIPAYYNSAQSQYLFLYPDISSQFGADTIISVLLYALGFIGLLLMYQSTRSASKPRQAYMLLIVGVTFVLLSYIFLEGAVHYKLTGGQ